MKKASEKWVPGVFLKQHGESSVVTLVKDFLVAVCSVDESFDCVEIFSSVSKSGVSDVLVLHLYQRRRKKKRKEIFHLPMLLPKSIA